MIRSFRHKGLSAFFNHGDVRHLPVTAHARVSRMLRALNAASKTGDVNLPGYRFHPLQGNPQRWSIWVTGNYRITFGWDDAGPVDVDIEDYH